HCKTQKTLICNKMNGEKGEEVAPRCRLSDPAHPHTLCRRDNPRYACDPCNYLVHLKCIQPPQAIHQDHLADTSSLPPPT
ncbi:hypothetical protein HID58_036273, partial [Brassica napus]